MTTEMAAVILDAVALVRANQLRDADAVQRIMQSPNIDAVAVVAAQMVIKAANVQGVTLDDFLDMEIQRTLDAGYGDVGEMETQ